LTSCCCLPRIPARTNAQGSAMLTRPSPFVLLCASGMLAIFSSTMSKNPVLPLFARDLGASPADIGFIAAASTVIGIVASIPAGALSDIYGRRRVILGATVIFASAPLLYLLVSAPWHLVAVRLYHGFATAVFGPVAMALVADLF
jgi:DHA1 family multidrug resistance protein-like MFS transporter